MALTVANNSSAAMALGELRKNSSNLAKDLKRVSSGVKIAGAGDGASEYAISEGMRCMIRALNQDIENTKTGRDIIKVAEGGIQSIIEELRTLKELALNSANDHNSAVDRAILQKEYDQRMANIDSIAEETNYNGKLLLNGTYRKVLEGSWELGRGRVLSSDTVTNTNTTGPVVTTNTSTSMRTSGPISNTTRSTATSTSSTMPTTGTTEGTPVTATNTVRTTSTEGPTTSTNSSTSSNRDTTEDEATITEVRREVTTTNTTNTTVETVTDTTTTTTTKISTIVSAEEVTGTELASYRMINNGTTALTESGVYKFAEDYTGNLLINADNITLIGSAATLEEVYITGNSNNIYLKDVHIRNTQAQDKSTIDFSNDGTLHIIGDNSIEINATSSKYKATIHATGDLSVLGKGNLSITRRGTSYVGFSGAVIGANWHFYGSQTGISDAVPTCGNISIGKGLTLNISEQTSGADAASIGGARGASCGNISAL